MISDVQFARKNGPAMLFFSGDLSVYFPQGTGMIRQAAACSAIPDCPLCL